MSAQDPAVTTDLSTGPELATLSARPAAGAPLPGAFPGYVIQRELGRGGMGIVYLARQTQLNRLVALKVVRTDLVGCV